MGRLARGIGVASVALLAGACTAGGGEGARDPDARGDRAWRAALEADLDSIEAEADRMLAQEGPPPPPLRPADRRRPARGGPEALSRLLVDVRRHVHEVLGRMARMRAEQGHPEEAVGLGWKAIEVDVRFATAAALAHAGRAEEAVQELRRILEEPEPPQARRVQRAQRQVEEARVRMARMAGEAERAGVMLVAAQEAVAALEGERGRDAATRRWEARERLATAAGDAALARAMREMAQQSLAEAIQARERASHEGHETR